MPEVSPLAVGIDRQVAKVPILFRWLIVSAIALVRGCRQISPENAEHNAQMYLAIVWISIGFLCGTVILSFHWVMYFILISIAFFIGPKYTVTPKPGHPIEILFTPLQCMTLGLLAAIVLKLLFDTLLFFI